MKNLTLIFAMICSTLLSAQDIIEKNISMSLGPQNAFYVEILGSDKKLSEKTFSEFVKEFGKMKENAKAREHFLMATKIPVINGTSPVDLYAKFEEGKGMATTYVWVDLGGAFINTKDHASQSSALRQFIKDYYVAVRKKVVAEEVKVEEKGLLALEKELKKLKEKNDGFHNDIEKAKLKIAESEKNIEKNVVDQENKLKEISTQKDVLIKVTEKLNDIGKKD